MEQTNKQTKTHTHTHTHTHTLVIQTQLMDIARVKQGMVLNDIVINKSL